MPAIYHGTPMTPRAALEEVCQGRSMCVSFYRPDDVEAVERISPRIMFRQRRVFVLASGRQSRGRMGGSRPGLVALLSVAGSPTVRPRSLGGYSRPARSAEPAQRCAAEGLAVRNREGCPALAHGWPAGTSSAALRGLFDRGARLDRRPQARACGLRQIPRPHGRSGQAARQPMARTSHDARNSRGLGLPLRQRRLHIPCTEWTSL